jgi:hypothetical protein
VGIIAAVSDVNARDVWGFRTPPSWALRALEKGIIDPNRFEALLKVASQDSDLTRRRIGRRTPPCACRRHRARRGCTHWRF